MIGFDANMTSLWLCPNSKAPADPLTNKPIERVAERFTLLIMPIEDKQMNLGL
jgi:hypothetical protein